MNNEYLWSKKENDPEIERLEGLLTEFRFVPGIAPVFVSETPTTGRAFFGKRFVWTFGLATPTFALAVLGFWYLGLSSVGNIQVRVSTPATQPTEMSSDDGASTPVMASADKGKSKPRIPLQKNRPTLVKTIYRSRQNKADRSETLTAKRLTSEEKYAYDRLRLALSIAGTKLKVVQDTIDRSGELEKRSIRNDK